DNNARPADDCKRRHGRWPRDRPLTVAFSARHGRRVASAALQIACSDHCKEPNSRPPDGLTRTSNPTASRWNIADSPGANTLCSRAVVTITGFTAALTGTHIGQPSTNIDLERQTSWTRTS